MKILWAGVRTLDFTDKNREPLLMGAERDMTQLAVQQNALFYFIARDYIPEQGCPQMRNTFYVTLDRELKQAWVNLTESLWESGNRQRGFHLHCQHGWIWNQLGDTPLSMSVVVFQVNLTEERKPTLNLSGVISESDWIKGREKRKPGRHQQLALSTSSVWMQGEQVSCFPARIDGMPLNCKTKQTRPSPSCYWSGIGHRNEKSKTPVLQIPTHDRMLLWGSDTDWPGRDAHFRKYCELQK